MDNFFNNFRPIRNTFRKLNLWDVLEKLYKINRRNNKTVLPEIIEFIYLNSIIYSPDYKNIKLKNPEFEWNKLLRQSNDFQSMIDKHVIEKKGFDFFYKFMLNQLKTNINHYHLHLYRYYYIFSNAVLSEHFSKLKGISFLDFYTCAMWIHSKFDKTYVIDKSYFLRKANDNTTFSIKNVNQTLDILSTDLHTLKQNLKQQLRYDSSTFITHEYEHIKKPIFESNEKLYCLFPDNLLYQYTAGIYYIAEVYDYKHKLNNVFGDSFECYVGEVLKKNQSKNMTITKEISFNRNQNKTSDWIIQDKESVAFIECKTKRLKIISKKYEDISESDISSLVDAIVQVFKVFHHYRNGDIKELKYNSKKLFIPIIVTLEEWFAGFIIDDVNIINRVKSNLRILNIDEKLIDKYKLHVISISKFETDIQIIKELGFKEYYNRVENGNLNIDDFKTVSFFSKEIDDVILTPLEKQFLK